MASLKLSTPSWLSKLGTALRRCPSRPRHMRGNVGRAMTRSSSPALRARETVLGTEAYPQLPMKAEALLDSVARFHPLIDGNNRTAWTLMVLMLWINGYQHDFSTDAAFDLVVGVAAGDVSLEVSAGMIAAHLVRRQPSGPADRLLMPPRGQRPESARVCLATEAASRFSHVGCSCANAPSRTDPSSRSKPVSRR
jgi:death-on-curing protein